MKMANEIKLSKEEIAKIKKEAKEMIKKRKASNKYRFGAGGSKGVNYISPQEYRDMEKQYIKSETEKALKKAYEQKYNIKSGDIVDLPNGKQGSIIAVNSDGNAYIAEYGKDESGNRYQYSLSQLRLSDTVQSTSRGAGSTSTSNT